MTGRLPPRPVPITVLSILLFFFGVFAFLGSLFLWGKGFILTFPPGVDLTYPVTDILINVPASLIAAIGLWRLRWYGYLASYFVAGFYIYASVEIFVQVAQAGPSYPIEIVIPQVMAVVVAVVLVTYLWRKAHLFAGRAEAFAGQTLE